MITDAEKNHFETFGFLVLRQFFAAAEMEIIIAEFEDVMLEDRGGKPFAGLQRQIVSDWFKRRAAVHYLIDDERLRGPIKQLLGPNYFFKDGNDGNFYVGDTGWHPDLGWDPSIPAGRMDPYRLAGNMTQHYVPSIKAAFYLDSVDADTGCLRVIPGSHRSPFHEMFWSLHLDIPARAEKLAHVGPKLLEMWERDTGSPEGGEQLLQDPDLNHFGLAPSDIPGVAIESEPGDALFFSHQLWHASFGGRSGRRMFTMNYMTSPSS